MIKLSDTQLVILTAAAQRDDRNVLPLPGSLRGGAAAKVVRALLSRGLVTETTTDSHTRADAALNRIWRNDTEGRAVLLHINDGGLAAIGIGPDDANTAPAHTAEAPTEEPTPDTPSETEAAPKARAPRTGTKQEALIAMLRAQGGATIEEIVAATGWLPHTARGAMSGALKKKLGLTITSEKVEGRGRAYMIADE